MRVYLETLGCRLNYAEMAQLGRRLSSAGHELAASADEAEVCVLNSCAVTGEAARKSRQLARQLAQANPGAELIVTGCYATLEAESVSTLPNVRLVVGNDHKDDLIDLIADLGPALSRSEAHVLPLLPAAAMGGPLEHAPAPDRTRAFVKVQDGCHNHCTFCIVTVARGEERSRSVGEVVDEIKALQVIGYQEAVLTGVHLGGYGRDNGRSLRELVYALLGETQIPRIRLSSLEPFDLSPDFFDLWPASGGRLMPHLHLPAQSGSDAVLRRMARRNRTAEFESLVEAARAKIPGLTVTTDLIAGFPGETEEQFAETAEFARRVRFAHLHVFPYSARTGTAAARFAGQIPGPERRRRARALMELDAELGRSVREEFVGQIRPVLWENGASDPENSAGVLWAGLTDNYLRVRASAPAGPEMHNRITLVRLTGIRDEDLLGTNAERTER